MSTSATQHPGAAMFGRNTSADLNASTTAATAAAAGGGDEVVANIAVASNNVASNELLNDSEISTKKAIDDAFDFHFNVAVIGDVGVGKTSIILCKTMFRHHDDESGEWFQSRLI